MTNTEALIVEILYRLIQALRDREPNYSTLRKLTIEIEQEFDESVWS
jgi:hypothetical protein